MRLLQDARRVRREAEGEGRADVRLYAAGRHRRRSKAQIRGRAIDVRKRLTRSSRPRITARWNPVAAIDPDSCYRAVSARDARFDGLFFTAVRTTGIYCRPICAARTPKRGSCAFYRTAAAAEGAGYRPCLRCRPELAPGRIDVDASLADAILRHLQARALEAGGVDALARDIGLSSRQVRRIVLERFGVTPIEIVQTQRLLFARKLLRETALSMTDVAGASGFRSPRRFNAAFSERYGGTPTDLRRDAVPHASRRRAGTAASAGDLVLRLSYRTPFDWNTLARYLALRATAGVEQVAFDDGRACYRRAVRIDVDGRSLSGWIAVTDHDPARDARRSHVATLAVTTSESLSPALMPTTQRLRELFDLDADPAAIAWHLRGDPLLAPEIDAAPGLRMPGAWDRFELALRAVLGQQVTVAGASTLAGRMAARFGDAVETPFAGIDRAAPTADRIACASLDDIASIGMPRSRANTVRELARFAVDGGLAMRPGTSCDDAVAALDAVPGIGPWTAHYIAMRALRHPDAFPAGDLGLRRALAALERTPTAPTEAALERRAEAWRPWRAYAAATLWHALSRIAAASASKTSIRTSTKEASP